MLDILSTRPDVWGEITLLASARSAGTAMNSGPEVCGSKSNSISEGSMPSGNCTRSASCALLRPPPPVVAPAAAKRWAAFACKLALEKGDSLTLKNALELYRQLGGSPHEVGL